LPSPKIFISYSHRDQKALEQIRRFLRPLERDRLIDWWADTRIEPGDQWAAEIDQALDRATVAVLLISQDFIDSDFIADKELPRLLARAAGDLKILPVFLSPSTADLTSYRYVDPRSGEEQRFNLASIQGYGSPNKPLADLTWPQREKIYAKLARQLRTHAGGAATAAERSRRGTVRGVRVVPDPTPARAYGLTVELERRGEQLAVRYHLPGTEPIASAELVWADVRDEIEPIAEVLDAGDERAVKELAASADAGCGAVLFDLLFGSRARWQPILRTVFAKPDGPPPNPPWAPVRLRIATGEPLLLGLPWRLTAWDRRILADEGWVFTTTHVVDPVDDYTSTAPSDVLIVAPAGAGADPGHPRAVRDVLTKAWPTGREPGYVRIVKTRRQLENALQGMRPDVVYVYAGGEVAAGPRLLLEGNDGGVDRLALAELPELFDEARHRPKVIYLNATGLGSAALPEQLTAEVPLVIRRRLPGWTEAYTSCAVAWFQRWFGQGKDPVAALHQLGKEVAKAQAESSTLVVHSSYRTWKTATFQASARDRLPDLRLDRDRQKAEVRKKLAELARSDTRRVLALVAYAAAGNSIDSLWKQLRHYLDLELEGAEIAWVTLKFPVARSQLRRALEDGLKLQLGADAGEPVAHLLRRHGPTAVTGGKRPVLWLDWGVFGPGTDQQAKLTSIELREWLGFSSQFLGAHCPDDLRVVSYLAIEVETSHHSRLRKALQEHRRQPWCRTPLFQVKVVPPLGEVSEDDLLDFLDEPENSSCPPGIQAGVAERLIAKTGGEFEPTVALLREAERGSWYDLLSRLRREQGAELPDDEPF